MKNLLLGLVCGFIVALALGAGGDANDPNVPTQQQVVSDINDLKTTADGLKSAVYYGTALEVLDQVIYDVNAVSQQAQTVLAKAQQNLSADTRRTAMQRTAILNKLNASITRVDNYQRQEGWYTFVRAVADSVAATEPNDPNYVQNLAMGMDCLHFVCELTRDQIRTDEFIY